MKLGGSKAAPTPIPDAAPPAAETPDLGVDTPAPASGEGPNDKPFDDKPFDAGVQADENTDPKKFIEQLTGKLGQSLRKYTETQGQPDFKLEKFAINSLLSACHTSEMDGKDQTDIIKKVETGGKGDDEGSDEPEPEGGQDVPAPDSSQPAPTGESPAQAAAAGGGGEGAMNEMALNDHNAQALIKIYDNGSDQVKQVLSRLVSYSDKVSREQFLHDLQDEVDYEDLEEIFAKLKELGVTIPEPEIQKESFMLDNPKKNNMFQEGSNDILEETGCQKGYKKMGTKEEDGKQVPNCVKINENLNLNKKSGIFANKTKIKAILKESLNQDEMNTQPATQPTTKPAPTTKPTAPAKPSRRDKPFHPVVTPGVKPNPKANVSEEAEYELYHGSFSSAVQAAKAYAESKGFTVSDEEWFNQIASGPAKPNEGNTNRYSLELFKKGVLSKKKLHIQVYGMSHKYELNCYIQ